jgi:sigma-B regulation protein RsbU (phosphoserine phosphatase)
MITDAPAVNPPQDFFLHIDGQRWPCRAGDVIGRAGTLALDYLQPVPVLSRRHLMIEHRGGTWYAVALPEARNETYLAGLPMLRGIPYPLNGLQYLQVDSFHFQLGPDSADGPVPAWTAPAFAPAASGPTPSLTDETLPASRGISISSLPVALVETDLRLNLLTASPSALSLLGEHALGKDLDEFAPDCTRLRNALLRLNDGEASGPLEVMLQGPRGPLSVELTASRCGESLLVHLRDLTLQQKTGQELQQLSGRFASQTALLAELSLSKAFQEGDVAKSLTLLAHRATAALDCRRVSAWLRPEASAAGGSRKVVCQVCHDTGSTAKPGTLTDLEYCPLFFDPLATDEPWAVAKANSPILNLLQQMGFAQPDTTALLCVALQHGDGFHGVLCFEKNAPDAGWTSQDREFALGLASYGVLALQTRERREALRRLQTSEARMTAELEEANHYIQRVLPSPIQNGPVTAEWLMQPAEALGGDSFGYHWVGDLFVMYVLDVVGHGTGMALLSISVLNNVRARLLLGEAAMADPAGVLMDLNAAFPMENQNNMLFSMWYGVFDRQSRRLTYSSAGHPPAILLLGDPPEDGEDYAALGSDGPSVGAMEGMIYTNGSIRVDPGSKLYIFTDGAFEIPLGPDREWTFDEFTAVVRTTRYMEHGEPAYLRKRIGALCSVDSLPDDFTIVRFSFVE